MVGVGEGPSGWAKLHNPLTPYTGEWGERKLLEKGQIRASQTAKARVGSPLAEV